MANSTKQMVYRGDWLICANYSIGEVVLRNGALWLAVAQNAGTDPDSEVGMNYWMLIGSEEPAEKNHNELDGLQGGDTAKGEFFHVTKDHLAALKQAHNPSESNPFLTVENMPALEKRVADFQMREKPEGTGALYAAEFGGGAFVAVGDDCAVRSLDGRNWALLANVPAGHWRGTAYGGGVFAALGLAGKAMWSDDSGETWTESTAPEVDWNALAFGNGMFIGVSDGKVVKSLDGKTGWTAKDVLAGYGEDIAFGNGVFVAIGPAGALTSTDGETWTEQETPRATWRCVVYGNGKFVALGGKCIFSTDGGQTWTESDLPSGGWDAVCHGGGFFAAVGNSDQSMVTGDGALDWTQTAVPNFLWRALAFGLDTFVAVGSGIMAARVVDAAAALNRANGPSGENAFATLLDITEMREELERMKQTLNTYETRIVELEGCLTIEGDA